MAAESSLIPGHTDTEKRLLREIMTMLHAFTAQAAWEWRLPVAVDRAYVMERLGNTVALSICLDWRTTSSGQKEVMLLLDVKIKGTGREKWTSATGSFCQCRGTATQVAAAIAAYHTDISPVQVRLAHDYYGAFYDS